jgi:hypothetical protein
VSYDDWSRQFQELYETTPGIADLEEWETLHVAALFEAGFTHTAAEYDREGLDPSEVEAIRAEFFTYMGLGDDARSPLFDWEEWREALGYGNN